MLLNGWKEIASYLRASVRTAQRWEDAGLPIARPGNGMRGSVIADSDRLNRWLQQRRDMSSLQGSANSFATRVLMQKNVQRAQFLAEQIALAREEMQSAVDTLSFAVSEMRSSSGRTIELLTVSSLTASKTEQEPDSTKVLPAF